VAIVFSGNVFNLLHSGSSERTRIPPFFIFQKYPTAVSARSVQFKGLAAPGFPGLPATADLVAVWKTSHGQRFQNYRAAFTVLNVPVIKRAWIDDLVAGCDPLRRAPSAWLDLIRRGRYNPLTAESTTVVRNVKDQVPGTPTGKSILNEVFMHFKDTPHAFEAFAARIFQMHDQRCVFGRAA
jgi:hypothetical protein